jgi:energy-coupling factor transporter ATP-binding protein EcfA2
MITLEDIHYGHPSQGTALFNGLGFAAKPGERVAIVGGEGSGKSTLMRLMAGLIPPQGGSLHFMGQPLSTPPAQPGGIGLLFRDSANHFLTPLVQEEILLSLIPVEALQRENRMARFLKLSGLPSQASSWSLSALSSGQQSRVALAALLAAQPRLILADEPGLCLDKAGEEGMALLFRTLCEEEGVTQVVFTSRMERARRFSDRVLFLDRGILTLSPFPEGGG